MMRLDSLRASDAEIDEVDEVDELIVDWELVGPLATDVVVGVVVMATTVFSACGVVECWPTEEGSMLTLCWLPMEIIFDSELVRGLAISWVFFRLLLK